MFLNKGYRIPYLLRGVFLYIVLLMSERRGELEYGDTVFFLEAL